MPLTKTEGLYKSVRKNEELRQYTNTLNDAIKAEITARDRRINELETFIATNNKSSQDLKQRIIDLSNDVIRERQKLNQIKNEYDKHIEELKKYYENQVTEYASSVKTYYDEKLSKARNSINTTHHTLKQKKKKSKKRKIEEVQSEESSDDDSDNVNSNTSVVNKILDD